MVEGVSSFGPLVKRYCLCITYYLWAFSYPPAERRKKIDLTTDSSRKDVLGAVKPFVGEVAAALDDPTCHGLERAMLQDFADSYEAILELVGLPIERVDPNWDQFQITADTRLNTALFEIFRGLDLYQRGHLELAAGHLLPGWEKLLRIEQRRALPLALQRLIQTNQDLVTRFERDLARARERPAPPPDTSDLPAIGELLQARSEGRAPGLGDMSSVLQKSDAPAPPPAAPAPEHPHRLVIALDAAPSAAPSAAPRTTAPEAPAPPDPPRPVRPPKADPEPEPAALNIPLRGASFAAPGSEGPPSTAHLMDSLPDLGVPSDPGRGVDSLPAIDLASLPPLEEEGEDNPWAEITDELHVSSGEVAETRSPVGDRDSLVEASPEAPPAAGKTESELRRALEKPPPPDPTRTTAPGGARVHKASHPPQEAARHSELAELFEDD